VPPSKIKESAKAVTEWSAQELVDFLKGIDIAPRLIDSIYKERIDGMTFLVCACSVSLSRRFLAAA
jgi:hypothetical protein